MATDFITIMLRAWYSEPRIVAPDDIVLPLHANLNDPTIKAIRHGKRPQSASQIVFLEAERDQYGNQYGSPPDPEASERMFNDIVSAFEQAASWLNARPIGIFEAMQQAGIKMDIFIGLGISSDQVDLSLPPRFLVACGERNLRIEIISND